MKVYTVMHEWGEYSDKGWSLHAVFSSEEKAQAYVDKLCFKIDPESKREEWEATLLRATEETKAYSLEETKRRLEQAWKQYESLLRTREVLKAKQVGAEFGRTAIPQTEKEITEYEAIIARGGEARTWGIRTLEEYMNTNYRPLDRSNLSILEVEVDKEPE
jgi:hypothetical protein